MEKYIHSCSHVLFICALLREREPKPLLRMLSDLGFLFWFSSVSYCIKANK